MSLIKRITESGVKFAPSKAEQRNILLTNYISLVAVFATFMLLIAREIFAFTNLSVAITLLFGCVLFIIPIILNHFGYYNVSRLALCWLPALYQLYAASRAIDEAVVYESSTYVGLRFFIIAFSCFPFLVFDISNKKSLFFVGLLGPMVCLFGFDTFLKLMGLGYHQVGLSDSTYEFNNVRVVVSVMIVGASSYFLKKLVQDSEKLNEQLIDELEEKNELIQKQASEQLRKLNKQLLEKVKQLSEREFVLNQSQKIANVGSWEYKLNDRKMFWSEEMYNIFGLNKNLEITLSTLVDLLLTEERPRMNFAMRNLVETGQPYDIVVGIRTPFGYNKWIRLHAFPLYENNTISGARGICHDITFYKESEERLRTSEEKFSKAFNNNPDLITIIRESDLVILDSNDRIGEILGFDRAEVIGKRAPTLNLFLSETDRQNFFNAYFASGQKNYEGPLRKKDGTIIQVIISSIRISISGEWHMMSVIKDITDRKMAEEKFLQAFDLSPDLMLIYRESDSTLIEANRKLEKVSGFTREEVIGHAAGHANEQRWAVPEEREAFFKEYYATGSAFQEVQLKRKNGELFFATVGAQRIVLSGQNHLIIVVRDITERKQAQRELIISQANLNATINNTEIMIWSVDRDFNLITYNKAFAEYVKAQYGIEVKHGKRIMDTLRTPDSAEMTKKWSQIYLRALSGEAVTLAETRFGKDFNYSISPIIEESKVIGVSIFAENVTERNQRDKALAEAQRKIGELRLMALRSVMNPHFIFNVLNSIQFFIAKNDRL
ncbi:MAG TPA: PAS domain S-box protein, partial [Chryseosolibacter sp.]